MAKQVVARFLVDRPVQPGMVRAILDTLAAQGGAYAPQLVRRARGSDLQRISWSRPAGLLQEVGERGTQTTFMRVAEGQPEPVLAFQVSESPRTRPTAVTLSLPAETVAGSSAIEQILGVCKGLYLFLEAPLGITGIEATFNERVPVHWANFYGPQIVAHVGPARILTSMAFIVEILPDGGIMLVTHPSPDLARTPEGCALRRHIADATGVSQPVDAIVGRAARRGTVTPVGAPCVGTRRPPTG